MKSEGKLRQHYTRNLERFITKTESHNVQAYVSLVLLLEKYVVWVMTIDKSQLLSLVRENHVMNLLLVFGFNFYFQCDFLGFVNTFVLAYGPFVSGHVLVTSWRTALSELCYLPVSANQSETAQDHSPSHLLQG